MRIFTILLAFMTLAIEASAQSLPSREGIEPFATLPEEFPYGKYEGNNVMNVGWQLSPRNRAALENEIIPEIDKRLSNRECDLIPIVGVVDPREFVQGENPVRQQELGDARAASVKEVVEEETGWPTVWLPTEYSFGERRTVAFYCVDRGVSLEEVEKFFRDNFAKDLENLRDRVTRLENQPVYRDRTDEIIKVVREEGSITRSHVTKEHEKTRSVLGGLATNFFVSTGYYASHYLNHGFDVRIGFENSGGSFFFEGSATPKEHGRFVEERGPGGAPAFLSGHGFTAGVGAEHNIYSDRFEVLASISMGYFHRDIGDPSLPEDHEEEGGYARGELKIVYAPFEEHRWIRLEAGAGPELLFHSDHRRLLDGEPNSGSSYQFAPNEFPDPITGPFVGVRGYIALRWGGQPHKR